jgi:4-amino-4-deoxy-L-arabinose transferase-like glycosyltransferase
MRVAFVLLVLGLAVGLRAVGLEWGLPTAGRDYPYHPDEPVVALATLQIDLAAGRLTPGMYNYGSLCLFLDRLAVDLAAGAGWLGASPASTSPVAHTLSAVILVGRWLSVLLGVLTVAVIAALGRRLYGAPVGVMAAMLLALAPLHLAQGHYNTVDVPAAFWTTLCLLAGAAALERPNAGIFAAAGACAGLAASTKYNAGLVLLAPFYALAIIWRDPRWRPQGRFGALVSVPAAALAAFLLTTPGVFRDPAAFQRDFFYEVWHSGAGHGLVFVHTPPAWWYHLTRSLPDGLGLPLTLAVVAGVAAAVARRRAADGLLLSFILPYCLLIGTAQVKFARYLLPILPALLLLAARLLAEGGWGPAGKEEKEAADRARPPRSFLLSHSWIVGIRSAATLIVLLWTGGYAVAMAAVFARPDPRDQAAAWVAGQRREGELVGLLGEPWFYSPPLAPSLGCTHILAPVCGGVPPAWIVAPGTRRGALSSQQLDRWQPVYLLASEFEYGDSLRLREETGHTDATLALLDYLPGRYVLAHTFRNRPRLGPLRWFLRRPPVHDLLYPMPDVRVYRQIVPTIR